MMKILLLCAAGMSTSMLVKKMEAHATANNIEVEIDAQPVDTFTDSLDHYDIFLLGPQVRFKQAELQAIADTVNKYVGVIDMMDYGMMKGDKVLTETIAIFNEKATA
ncbi:PTS sugar transporter subunit IIB [Vibrio sp. SS-MA-C1-2]|uniref:PTS sugar transporter subunit IIB n=1 Tax=Vibrio sp. SS-MA-C1-2 TaxID=2908646 RepID=UPI001F4043B8|nr:PTS sugar transporter subunit IIB [Vibrio sp. SS-MA-C1-2]UJF17456.1 PTS sugar transporter subunit IIB [Vibrio sp. SS-MA-C1-2]